MPVPTKANGIFVITFENHYRRSSMVLQSNLLLGAHMSIARGRLKIATVSGAVQDRGIANEPLGIEGLREIQRVSRAVLSGETGSSPPLNAHRLFRGSAGIWLTHTSKNRSDGWASMTAFLRRRSRSRGMTCGPTCNGAH